MTIANPFDRNLPSWAMASPEAGAVYRLLVKLDEQLSKRQRDFQKYGEYYDGEHRLLYSSEKWRTAFGGLFKDFADNWCELVVDAVEERLDVVGFRFGDNTNSDNDAWKLWQNSDMDAMSQIAHTEALVYGVSYAMVWADVDRQPEITIESPLQVVVSSSTSNRRQRIAAYKRWLDDSGFWFCNLYTPEWIFKFRSNMRVVGDANYMAGDTRSLVPREVDNESWPLKNPLNSVPVVPLVNRPRLSLSGMEAFKSKSEIAGVIPVQDAINKLLLDMIVASEFGSFRQRWVTGMEIPVDPVTKKPVEPFKAAVDRLWMTEEADAKFGEFSQTDLGVYVKGIELLVQHVASQTRTPPHYFYLSGNFPSGESIKSAETGLVAKTRRKQRHFSDPWEEIMRLSFAILGDPRQKINDGEVIWADPESHSEAEHIDALVKKRALGVPDEQLWEDAGYSPQTIQRFKVMQTFNSIMNAARPMAPTQPAQPTQPQPARPLNN